MLLSKDFFKPPQDLLLRPTDLAPGFYREGSDEDIFAVTQHEDGKYYEMLWCDEGEGQTYMQPGDLLFEGTSMKSMNVDYEESEGVIVERMSLEPSSLYAELVTEASPINIKE